MASRSSIGISDIELFWSLVDKGDRKFSSVRDFPFHSRNRADPDFHKAFKIYTRLWKLQQENRQKLVEAGLKRWEIGEIATRIAQLYYVQYQRTSESAHLTESYIFYEAVLTREYFKEGILQEPGLAKKQLRFLARFLVVCILIGRKETVLLLGKQLMALVDECKKNFQEMEIKEWKQAVRDLNRFLHVDSTFMNMRSLRYSYTFDSLPNSIPSLVSSEKKRRLSDALLSSYHLNEVKFAELTLDTFRMLQCLEWEPCGSILLPSSPPHYGQSHLTHWQDIRDPSLPPNPRKAILQRASVTQYLLILATMCEELPMDGILLLYLSSREKDRLIPPVQTEPSTINDEFIMLNSSSFLTDITMTSAPDSLSDFSANMATQEAENNNQECCLRLCSQGKGGSGCLYPSDLIPFTRKPLFLIIDSDASHSFKAIHGAEKGETAAMLISPESELSPVVGTSHSVAYQHGSQFTLFLTAPLQAFCLLMGITTAIIDKDICNDAEKLLSASLKEWELILTASDSLNPVWVQALGDPFLRRLLIRFIFCRTVLALNKVTSRRSEFLPDCLPALPESVLPKSPASQSAVRKLARFFDVTEQFIFSEGIILSDVK